MSVTVEISNPANLQRVRAILGTNSDSEAVDLALEKIIEENEPVTPPPRAGLPDEYWDDLFSEPMVPNNAGSQAIIDERNEDRF